MPLCVDDLYGAWRLDRFEISFSDDRPPVQPFGQGATGLLMYAANGTMSAILSRADRVELTSSRLETATQAPADQRAAAFDSYLSYGGRWRIEGDEVVHEVTLALVPNLVGQHNRRHARLEEGVLTLSYRLTARSGVERTYAIRWVR